MVFVGTDDPVRLQKIDQNAKSCGEFATSQGRAESPAPTSFFGASGRFVGVDAHIDPAERTDFTITFGEFVIAKWGDEGIAPAQIWNPSSEKTDCCPC